MRSLSVILLAASCAALVGACTPPGAAANKSTVPQAGATTCDAASLSLAPTTVVGSLDGKPVTFADLGPELQKAEERAHRDYCDTLYANRRMALDNYVAEKLVGAAATKAGITEEEWIKAELDKRIGEVPEEEILKFYDERKGEGVPPLELVRDQIAQMLKAKKSQEAIVAVLDDLKKQAKVDAKLPDIRSAAVDMPLATHTPVKGKAGAKVKVVEFADFQCPYCSQAADTMQKLKERYGDKVEFAYRHFPLRSIHPQAQRAAEYAQCANEQGKFWELHDKMYAAQKDLGEESLKAHAQAISLDQTKLDTCLQSGQATAQVDADFKAGEEVGVEGTPAFFINGRQYRGNPSFDAMSAALEAELGG